VPEVEFVLSMGVGEVNVGQKPALFGHLPVKRRARYRCVQHALVEIGLVVNRVLNLFGHVVWCVVLQSNEYSPQLQTEVS